MTANPLKPGKRKSAAGQAFRAILFLAIGFFLIYRIADWDRPDIQPTASMRSEDAALSSMRKEAERVADAFIEKNRAVLAESAGKDLDALETAVVRLEGAFDEKEAAIDELLEDLFSLPVEAQIIYHMFGGMDEAGRYVQSVIEARWGDSQAQRLEIGAIVEALAMDLQGNHNQLMLALEADLRALPVADSAGQNASATLEENFQKSFGRLMNQKIPALVLNKLTFDIAASAIAIRPCSFAVEKAAVGVASRVAAVSAGRTALAAARWSTSVVSFGASVAVGVAADWAITEAAKYALRPDLLESLQSWRRETVAAFRNDTQQAIRQGWELRAQDLREALTLEVLVFLKTQSDS